MCVMVLSNFKASAAKKQLNTFDTCLFPSTVMHDGLTRREGGRGCAEDEIDQKHKEKGFRFG